MPVRHLHAYLKDIFAFSLVRINCAAHLFCATTVHREHLPSNLLITHEPGEAQGRVYECCHDEGVRRTRNRVEMLDFQGEERWQVLSFRLV